jgi:CRISPR/Cas system CSM-associated protein Csm2 small subunit
MNQEEDSFDEENYHETTNTSMIIANLSHLATMKTIARGIQPELVSLSAKICQISASALRVAITNIINVKSDQVQILFEMILQLYLSEGNHSAESIKSQEFTNYILEMYIKSNTSDEAILKIKDILDEWLKECSTNYLKTERAATKINFRKATLLYFTFVLQKTYTIR